MEISDPDDLSDAAGYLRAMAFHEAGHAMLASSLDLPVGDIYIRGIGEGDGGAQIGGAENLSFIDRIAVCFAGIRHGVIVVGATLAIAIGVYLVALLSLFDL